MDLETVSGIWSLYLETAYHMILVHQEAHQRVERTTILGSLTLMPGSRGRSDHSYNPTAHHKNTSSTKDETRLIEL